MDVKDLKLTLEAATAFVDGAIIIDEFDDLIFDDVLRRFPIWGRIEKREAPGETTGGFDQTAVGAARSADPRVMGFTAVSPTRAARTRKDIRDRLPLVHTAEGLEVGRRERRALRQYQPPDCRTK